MTELGRVLRKLRIDLDITLRTMAKLIDYSPALLSGIETGRTPLTLKKRDELVWLLKDNLQIPEKAFEKISKAADQSLADLTIDMSKLDVRKREQVASFARSLPGLDVSEIEEFLTSINKQK